ncbi:g11683 [Coccomyxa elongata]
MARPNRFGSEFYKTQGNATSSPSLDRAASLEEGRAGTSPSRSTFSIEQPSAGAGLVSDDSQDIPLIHVRWGNNGAELGANTSPTRGPNTAEPATPPRNLRSPARKYPTPEPSANPYQDELPGAKMWRTSWGHGLLSVPKRSRCPKPSTVFITILVLLLVLVLGLTIGHFVAPYVRTMTYLHAPAPAPPPGLEDLPAGAVGRPGGRDGTSIEGVGIGLETDYPSTIPTDGTSVTPTRNPYLDRNRQGAGSVSLTPGSQGP